MSKCRNCGHSELAHTKDFHRSNILSGYLLSCSEMSSTGAMCFCTKFEPQEGPAGAAEMQEIYQKFVDSQQAEKQQVADQRYRRDRFWQVLCAGLSNGEANIRSIDSVMDWAMELTKAALEKEEKL